jgi:hypothetical protein
MDWRRGGKDAGKEKTEEERERRVRRRGREGFITEDKGGN